MHYDLTLLLIFSPQLTTFNSNLITPIKRARFVGNRIILTHHGRELSLKTHVVAKFALACLGKYSFCDTVCIMICL